MRPVFIFLRQTLQRNAPNNHPITRRSFATKKSTTQVGGTLDESDLQKARKWLADFNINSIPRSICAVSFSRSSGPGGQNVNKVNSKATLRVPLSALLPLVPTILHQDLRTSRYVADRSDALVIQSDESRKQSSNVDSCYEKLYKVIQESAQNVIPGETSAEQRTRVRNLKAADTEARLKSKKMHSAKKSNRRKSNDD